MRGRLLVLMASLFLEGLLLVIFSRMDTPAAAVLALLLFSLFVQASEGAVYGIVPYVVPDSTGAVTGVVGAGGSAGAVLWGFVFLFSGSGFSDSDCFLVIGLAVVALSLLTPLIFLKGGHAALCGRNPLGGPLSREGDGRGAPDTPAFRIR
mmetsp:Transcript_38697/g.86417  ORF Transcript_38697/g.86417 Transcript_38697/m.86417 type:complete len:151 (-) Transcript_38697:540-992(-)